jgi:peptidoglycan/xylan/chitin deacetylase (PgdA/CDA1 family)
MDDGYTALHEGPRRRQAAPGSGPARGLPIAVQHRRRRAVALAVLAGISLILGIVVGSGSGGGSTALHHVAAPRSGYFARIRTLAGGGTGSFAAVEQSDENAAITRTLAYTPAIRYAGSQHREIALTLDDGPGPYTLKLLSVLDRYHVPVTFFEVGVLEQYFHAATAAIVSHGDPIGDHTESHAPMSKLSNKDQQRQLLSETAAIGAYGAPFPRMFRPPYGLWNSTTLSLLKKYKMLMVLWSADTSDYTVPGTAAIIQRALAGAKPGAIILMHDAGGNRSETVAALPAIIKKLRARGYKLVTVPRLILDNPPPKNQDLTGIQGAGG